MSSNMINGDYATALEMNADNSWAGDSASRTQVMNSESLGTYQRPLQVFKYMHIHEFMKGRQQYGNPAGTLGAAPQVRDGKRSLHLKSRTTEEDGDASEAKARKDGEHGRSSKSRSGRSKRRGESQDAAMPMQGVEVEGQGFYLPIEQDFLNKGYVVWEAIRGEWRGTAAQVAEARARVKARGREPLDTDEMENQLEDSDVEAFSQPVPLPELVEVLDELWQGERTL